MFERYSERARRVLFFARAAASTLGSPEIEDSTSIEIPFSESAQAALEHAAAEADKLRHPEIGPEHLLLGVLREEGTAAASILRDHRIDIDAVRRSVRSACPEVSSDEEADLC